MHILTSLAAIDIDDGLLQEREIVVRVNKEPRVLSQSSFFLLVNIFGSNTCGDYLGVCRGYYWFLFFSSLNLSIFFNFCKNLGLKLMPIFV